MLLVVKQDVSFDPSHISLLCSASRSSDVTSEACVAHAIGVMLETDGITNLVKQFFRWSFHDN
jgi:hypothetical protein